MGRACGMNWDQKNVYTILVGKPEGKRPLERTRHRWEDNIKILDMMGRYGLDRIGANGEL
jgi:hypothetical protein